MADRRPHSRPAAHEADDAPPDARVEQIISDLAQSEADEAAGRTDDGKALVARMRQAVVDFRSKAPRTRRA